LKSFMFLLTAGTNSNKPIKQSKTMKEKEYG